MEAMHMNTNMKTEPTEVRNMNRNTEPIEVRNVSKSFQMGTLKVPVLDRVNLKVSKGKFLSVMGASGSGKSTLLYLMGGLDQASEGTVLLNGCDLREMNDRDLSRVRRQKLGFVFQFYNLVPNMNVEENILLPVLLDGKTASSYQEKLNDVLGLTGLLQRRKNTPSRLSGGEQQRVAIARALIHDPEIILADEPIGNLDSRTGTGIMELLQKINRERKKTIVMVTHSAESATYGTGIIRLKDGRIIEKD